MAREPTSGVVCESCGGTPDACICDDLDRLLARVPDPPETGHGADWDAWLKGVVRESNAGKEVRASD